MQILADTLFRSIPILLYAELHYRFRFFPFSRYYKKEPEIIADAPHRLQPGQPLPILLLIKDAHRFPLHLGSVEISVVDEKGNTTRSSFKKDESIEQMWWYEIIPVNIHRLSGSCRINVEFHYRIDGKESTCLNDNCRGLLHKPFVTFVSDSPLPGNEDGWQWGDLHCHSWMTDDFVEFGAPLEVIQRFGNASGLAFVGVTDHSYDLDDKPGTWAEYDPELSKWKRLQTEIKQLNNNGLPLLIPGEEISTTNSKMRNVHTLVLNHPDFLHGSGDSGEQWFKTRSELSIQEVTGQLRGNSLTIAAHPRSLWTWTHRLLLKRGQWELEDMEVDGVAGFQILNGEFGKVFDDGLDSWIRVLLTGAKKFICAGNDAHGNFNRFRQVKHPMLSLWERDANVFGKCRTGIYAPDHPSVTSIIQALKEGRCVISDGPLLKLTASANGSRYTLGESVNGKNITIYMTAISSPEFGELHSIKLQRGDLAKGEERPVFQQECSKGEYRTQQTVELEMSDKRGYVRAELTSANTLGKQFRCYTNPIWINC